MTRRGRNRWSWLRLCGAGVVAATLSALGARPATATCSFTPTQDLFGVNVWMDDVSYVPSLQSLRAHWIRLECCKDSYDPSHAYYVSAIEQVHDAGIKVLLLVDGAVAPGQPHWDSSDAEWNTYRARYYVYLEDVARALGHLVDAWEIWNEPDFRPAVPGYDPGIPANQFGYLLRDAATIIRRYGNGELVVGGLAKDDTSYLLTAMDAAGGLADYDGVGVHTYCPAGWSMDWVRGELDTRYDRWYQASGQLPLWVTEAGGQTLPGDESTAATYVQVLFDHTMTHHADKVTHILYFTLWDTAVLVDRNEAFGLLRLDRTRRPAFDVFAARSPVYDGGACAGPGALPEKVITASYAAVPVVLDGNLDEWGELSPAELGTAAYVRLTASSGGDADISARVAFLWDETALYLAAAIRDDQHDGGASAGTMWQVDSLQLALDPDHDHTSGSYDTDADTEVGFALLNGGPATMRWVAPAGAAPWAGGIGVGSLPTGELVLEAAVPMSNLAPLAPTNGTTVGMSFLVNDADGAGREGWVEWTPGIGAGKDPSRFGDLILSGGPPPPIGPVCGNGVREGAETCDPPSACPTTCADANECTLDTSTGSAETCTRTCAHAAITACVAGDGCCPGGCAANTDSDCSGTCGDGVLDPLETCDPPSTCRTSCDDGDPCSLDTLIGSAANCNVGCRRELVSHCRDGDGCCPRQCTGISDSDCGAAPAVSPVPVEDDETVEASCAVAAPSRSRLDAGLLGALLGAVAAGRGRRRPPRGRAGRAQP